MLMHLSRIDTNINEYQELPISFFSETTVTLARISEKKTLVIVTLVFSHAFKKDSQNPWIRSEVSFWMR